MSHRLSKTDSRFKMKIKRVVGGPDITGQILDIPDTSRVSNFLSARRYLRTSIISSVKPSNVIQVNGIQYIVGEHGDGFFTTPIYKHFKLFEVTDVLTYNKAFETEDPITGLITKQLSPQLTKAYISLQPYSDISDKIYQNMAVMICKPWLTVDSIAL